MNQTNSTSFETDINKQAWLGNLIKAYQTLDSSIEVLIQKQTNSGRRLACSKGCAACCRTHQDIPVYPLELVGISWYATEKVSHEARDKLQTQLSQHRPEFKQACPFLVDSLCSIHPVRPMACRSFNVFDIVCDENEDAWFTRPDDVLQPEPQIINDALYFTLDFYKVTHENAKRKILAEGGLHSIVKGLHDTQLKSLAENMRRFDVLASK